MRVTGIAQREAWLARAMPAVEEVRPGLWSVPVPIPFSPLRYTLSYLVASGPGLIVVDPGWDSDDGWQALTEGLAAAGATAADVTGIVVTHVHPDHHGLSARLRAACGAWIAMHPAERDSLPARVWNATRSPGRDLSWLQACGVPPDVAAELGGIGRVLQMLLAMPEPDVLLEDGDLVPVPARKLRAVWTPGHTPGHLCLHEEAEDVLLTGDHVLPRITPNIAQIAPTDDPPLGGVPGVAGTGRRVRQRRGAARARVPVPRAGRPGAHPAHPPRPPLPGDPERAGPAGTVHHLAGHRAAVVVPGLAIGEGLYAPGRARRDRGAPGIPAGARAGQPEPGSPGQPGRRHADDVQRAARGDRGRVLSRGPTLSRGRILSRPGLASVCHQGERRTHDYLRHGITSLFATFNIADGTVISQLHRDRPADASCLHRMGCPNAIMLRCWGITVLLQTPAEGKATGLGVVLGGRWTARNLPGAAYAWAAVRACRVEAAPSLGPPGDRAPFSADRSTGAERSASNCLSGGAGRIREDDAAVAVGRAQRPALRVGVAGRTGQRPEGPADLRRRSARCGRADRPAGIRRAGLPR